MVKKRKEKEKVNIHSPPSFFPLSPLTLGRMEPWTRQYPLPTPPPPHPQRPHKAMSYSFPLSTAPIAFQSHLQPRSDPPPVLSLSTITVRTYIKHTHISRIEFGYFTHTHTHHKFELFIFTIKNPVEVVVSTREIKTKPHTISPRTPSYC